MQSLKNIFTFGKPNAVTNEPQPLQQPQQQPTQQPPTQQQLLKEIQWDETVAFTFPITGGQVIKVYDADTITIASKLPYDASPRYRLSVRLTGIDTPEIKGKGVSEEEKQAAVEARDFVSNLVLHKHVRLENIESEKYGRILADVYIGENNVHLNELLIQERYAVRYDGGTKVKPTSWVQYRKGGTI